MAKSKEISSKATVFAKGGNTKMFGKQDAGTQVAGMTSHQTSGSGKFAVGGKTKMFGYTGSKPAPAR